MTTRLNWLTSFYGRLAEALFTPGSLRFYLLGYHLVQPSRFWRRILARSAWHRAWLSGLMGVYRDDQGHFYGVCDREALIYRKGDQQRPELRLWSLLGWLVRPYQCSTSQQ